MDPATEARLREGLADVADLARQELAAFWASLDTSAAPEALVGALLEYVPVLTARYGSIAGSVAAEWYDEMRAIEGVRGRFRAVSGPLTPDEAVVGRVRSASAHLFREEDPSLTLAALAGSLSKYVLNPGRDTIRQSVFADPQARGWKRVVRAGGCDFCRMLAGRGGVYLERTVRFASHGKCRCAAAPNWDPSAPEVDVEMYRQSAPTASMSEGQRRRLREGAQEWIAANL